VEKNKLPVVKFERIRKNAYIPEKAHESDSGYDIRLPKGLHLKVNEIQLVRTGLRIELPAGYECQVRSRSGLPVKYGIIFALGVGTIDQDYRGEIMVALWNVGQERVTLPKGAKIAQLVFNKLDRVELVEAYVSTDTERGEGGFGSTGL
jgi:dUTP pyrophosphatase